MRVAELAEPKKKVQHATLNRGIYPGSLQVNRELQQWWLNFSKEAAKLHIPLRVVSGFRTFDEQMELLKNGRSRAGPGESPHNYGLALDIIHTTRGWRRMKKEGWLILHGIGMEVARKSDLDLRWGGDWNGNGINVLDDNRESFWDAAHWEIKNWRTHVTEMINKV